MHLKQRTNVGQAICERLNFVADRWGVAKLALGGQAGGGGGDKVGPEGSKSGVCWGKGAGDCDRRGSEFQKLFFTSLNSP